MGGPMCIEEALRAADRLVQQERSIARKSLAAERCRGADRVRVAWKQAMIVEVNGKTCFSKNLSAGQGKQVCGQTHGGWHEDSVKVTCTGDAVDHKFTVRVYTTLNSNANDESF